MDVPPPRVARTLSLALAILALTACQTQPTRAAVADRVGRPVAEMLAAYGAPAAEVGRDDGGREILWRYRGDRLEPRRPEPPSVGVSRRGTPTVIHGQRSPPRLVPSTCELSVIVTPGGLVSAWRALGDACLEVLDSPALWPGVIRP